MTNDPKSTSPIFVVGVPRSGTTLLRVMLNRHPRIALTDETYFFYYVHRRRRAFGSLDDEGNRARLTAAYLETTRVRRLGLDRDALTARLMAEGTDYPAFFATLLRTYAEARGKPRFGEKTPHHAWHVEDLLAWYPRARVIHLVRDPRDVCASLARVAWGTDSALAAGSLWRSLTQAAERCRDREGYLLVEYERLVADPEDTLRTICDFVGEDYEPAMLEVDEETGPVLPWFARAQKPLTQSRTGIWRQQLTASQAALVEWAAGPQMERLGYRREAADPTWVVKTTARLARASEEVLRRVRQLPRMWYFWVRPRSLAAEERWLDR